MASQGIVVQVGIVVLNHSAFAKGDYQTGIIMRNNNFLLGLLLTRVFTFIERSVERDANFSVMNDAGIHLAEESSSPTMSSRNVKLEFNA